MCVHRVWCSIDLGSRAPSWFTVPTGTTLSTPFYHMMLPQRVTRFACFAAHASQCVHKRRQYAYKAVHALMCFALLRSESVRTTKIFRDGFADPELFLHNVPHTTVFSDRSFSRSREPVRASTSPVCIQSRACFNVAVAS